MASSPTFDLNMFVTGFSSNQWLVLNDPRLKPQLNRTTAGAFQPGAKMMKPKGDTGHRKSPKERAKDRKKKKKR